MEVDKDFIRFLGTAGARFAVAQQVRSSAGIYISVKNKNIIIDPGPGTLVRLASSKPKIDVFRLDAVILTHSHIDHSNDVNIIIDAMTQGGLKKRGLLFTTSEALFGENAVVLNYLRGFLEDIIVLEAEREYHIGDINFSTSIRHQHAAETYGISFKVDGHKLSFVVDTKYFTGLNQSYQNSETLVCNVVMERVPKDSRIMHLNIEDVKLLAASIKPKRIVLTHFGMSMLKAKPWQIANKLTEELGINVIAANDGMSLSLSDVD